jgi:hypothetical protein
MKSLAFRTLFAVLGTAAIFGAAVYAQDSTAGKLKIHVSPSEAYIFVDGQGEDPGSRTIKLPAGTHKVLVATYGYRFIEKEVTISPGQDTTLDVSLEREGGVVFGPKGRIQIEPGVSLDAGDDAVLLNGKSPNYFVGHVDEFNNELFFHQELVVPPGKHFVTVTHHGKEVWSGEVPVAENQRVILTLKDGKIVAKDWPRGAELGSVPRFKSGAFSTSVAVAPVSSSVSANPERIECGQSSQLKWTSAETIDADMSHMSPVPTTGVRSVSPRETTTYELTAAGPGGVTKSSATVVVDPAVASSLNASAAEVHYRRIGDRVVEPGNVKLNWTTSNADNVSVEPLGHVDINGDRSLVITPTQTANGPVDETVNYTLTASNVCGGTETKVAPVHVTGSIEPVPDVLLHSVFYPTDYPTKSSPTLGLVRSQQDALSVLAARFTKYLEYDPDAKLSLSGHADNRGANKYNQFVSERRVQRVKEFLVARGVPENKIETAAYGEEQSLAKATVIELQQKNPTQAPEAFIRNFNATWLAHNRRVDVTLIPTNAESLRFYPNQAPDSTILWQRAKPAKELIEKNQ